MPHQVAFHPLYPNCSNSDIWHIIRPRRLEDWVGNGGNALMPCLHPILARVELQSEGLACLSSCFDLPWGFSLEVHSESPSWPYLLPKCCVCACVPVCVHACMHACVCVCVSGILTQGFGHYSPHIPLSYIPASHTSPLLVVWKFHRHLPSWSPEDALQCVTEHMIRYRLVCL